MTLYHYLALSGIIFSIGIYGALTRRNILGVLMSIELMFNATNISLVAFNHFLHPGNLWGQGFILFVITIAAAEAVVGLSLVLAIYRNLKSVYTENMNILHG
jgi:NADH:ubiquinone oxidoreductase subunit K